MSQHSEQYRDSVVIEDDVDLANVACAGKLLEYIRQDGHGTHFHFSSGTIVTVKSESLQVLEVRGAHGC